MGLFDGLKKTPGGANGDARAWRESNSFTDALCGAAIARHLMRASRGGRL